MNLDTLQFQTLLILTATSYRNSTPGSPALLAPPAPRPARVPTAAPRDLAPMSVGYMHHSSPQSGGTSGVGSLMTVSCDVILSPTLLGPMWLYIKMLLSFFLTFSLSPHKALSNTPPVKSPFDFHHFAEKISTNQRKQSQFPFSSIQTTSSISLLSLALLSLRKMSKLIIPYMLFKFTSV